MRLLHHLQRAMLSFSSLFNSKFTAIVTARTTNSVVDVVSAAVGADSQSRHNCYIMRTTLRSTSVRLSSFRMCHNSIYYLIIYNLQFSSGSKFFTFHSSLLTLIVFPSVGLLLLPPLRRFGQRRSTLRVSASSHYCIFQVHERA